ncbi:hypothetical protein ACHAQH_005278 [Verticillium albo-atrum]
MAVRFILGVFESCVQPAFIFMTATWWRREEQAVLTSLWYCMTGVQLMIGGLIAYGASHYNGALMKSWQMLFMVPGIATCVWAVFVGWFLPDSPMKAKCFDEDTKRLLIEHVRANETGIQNKTYKRHQVIEAVSDPVTWRYVLLQVTSTLIIGGLGVFSDLIISGFDFTLFETQLLNVAQGALTIIIMISAAFTAQRSQQTALTMHIWSFPAIIGTAVIYSIPPNSSNRVGLLIAFYCTQFFLAEGNLAWDAPRYRTGFTIHFCLYVIFNIILVAMRVLLTRRNKNKRDEKIGHSNAFADLTDKENPDFRYEF